MEANIELNGTVGPIYYKSDIETWIRGSIPSISGTLVAIDDTISCLD